MTIAQRNELTLPDSLSDLDRFLVGKTQEALADGLALERWCRDPGRRIKEFQLDLKRPYALPNKAFGYFSDLEIAGQTRTLIGVRQEVEFGQAKGPDPEEQLKQYVLRRFLPTSHWTYPDGWPGGFTYEQLLYCTADGRVGRYEGDERSSIQDWTLIGTRYAWSLFTVFLHDFVLKLGPVTKHMQEAATLVQHPDFVHVVERPAPGYKLEVAIGYPSSITPRFPTISALGRGSSTGGEAVLVPVARQRRGALQHGLRRRRPSRQGLRFRGESPLSVVRRGGRPAGDFARTL